MKWIFEKLYMLNDDLEKKERQAVNSRNWVLSDILSGQRKIVNHLIAMLPKNSNFPKIICYCGSLRIASEAFKKAEYEALMKGQIALLPCCMFVDIEREYGADSNYKQMADETHKRKIDICDEVFVLNVGGYIGQSTRSEIDYANSIGKPVIYLEPLNK